MCVYFISDQHNHVKIGITSGSHRCILLRLRQLQTGNPYQLVIRGYIECRDGADRVLEKTLHRVFWEHKFNEATDELLTNEWFFEDCILPNIEETLRKLQFYKNWFSSDLYREYCNLGLKNIYYREY